MTPFEAIQDLLHQRADLQARLNLLPYDGTPEIKRINNNDYLYVRKRVGSKVTSTYVDLYSEELHTMLLRYNREARELRKEIRKVNRELAKLEFANLELPEKVILNLDFARAHMKVSIYDQAILEGVATTFPQTEEIIDNGMISGVSASDVQKILNLKHAWEFILDEGVIVQESSLSVLQHIARLVNEGFLSEGGRIRGVPVSIGGTKYLPPLPLTTIVMEKIETIREAAASPIDVAIELCLYCMKTQIFLDGNKRTAILFANHYLIGKGGGLLVVPRQNAPEFKKLLVDYYEGADAQDITLFLKERCWRRQET